jgi:hypothetical protein
VTVVAARLDGDGLSEPMDGDAVERRAFLAD